MWTEESIEELKKLYIETDIPSDTLIKESDSLASFTCELNARLLKSFTKEDVATKLLSVRKKGNLPTIRN